MSAEKQARIRVTAKTDQAAAEFEKLAKAQAKASASLQQYIDTARKQNAGNRLQGFDQAAAQVQKSDGILSQFSRTAGGAGVALKALGGVVAGGVAAWTAYSQAIVPAAQKSMELQGVFGNLAVSIEPARAATQGLISDFQLAKSANTLVSFGVVKTSEDFSNLASAAQKLGARLGLSAESTMESLSAALGRNSKLMLDNLGIILNETTAQQRYAASVGKTVGQLTDEEKANAFKREAMKAIFAAAKDVKINVDGAAAAVVRFDTELENLKNRALGGERATISLRQGIAGLDEDSRKLIATSHIYGTDLDKLKGILRDAGVSQASMTVEVSKYGKILRDVVREEEERASALLRTKQGQRDFTLGLAAATKSVTDFIKGAETKERLKDIEREIALLGGNKKAQDSINRLLHEKAEITATQLVLEGKLEEAEKVRFEEELRELRALSDSAGHTTRGVKGMSAAMREWKRIAADVRAEQNLQKMLRGGSDTREFGEAARDVREGAMIDALRSQRLADRDEAIESFRSQNQTLLEIKLQGIEAEQAAGLDPWSLTGADPMVAAQREQDARLIALANEEDYLRRTLSGREQVQAREEIASRRRDILHTKELLRIAQEQKARDKFRGHMTMIGKSVADVHAGMAAAALQGAFASGESAKGMVKHFAAAKTQEMTILAVTEGIQAIASLAMFNFAGAAEHGAAAAAAAGEAAILGATYAIATGDSPFRAPGAGGGSSRGLGGASGGGSADGGAGGSSIPGGPPISRPGQHSPDGPPLPPPPQGGQGGGPVIYVTNQSLLPYDPTQQMLALRRALKRSEQNDGAV